MKALRILAILLFWAIPLSAQTYEPKPGDIIVSTNPDPAVQARYRLVGAGPPTHSAIVSYVIQNGELRLVLLESLIETGVIASDFSVLNESSRTDIRVRKLKRPLTQSETDALTVWATQQLGKAYPRMSSVYMAAALGRPTGPLHLRPHVDRPEWSCSSLVAAAASVTGRVNAAHVRNQNVMPIDFINGSFMREWDRPERLK